MQQGFGFGRIIKIASLAPKHEIRHKARACRDVLAKLIQLIGQQHEPTQRKGGDEHNNQRGKYSSDAPNVKVREAERIRTQVLEDDCGYQKTRNHKKHIHTDKPAPEPGGKRMEYYDRQHGNRPQAINIRSILQV